MVFCLQIFHKDFSSTEQNLTVRKALAWGTLNGMSSVWNYNLPRQIKLSFFYATVKSVLLYGSEYWTLKPFLQKSLDGCYTRMLRAVLNSNISKNKHMTNKILYEGIPGVNEKVAARRLILAGLCQRYQVLPASRLIASVVYVDILKDVGAQRTSELRYRKSG